MTIDGEMGAARRVGRRREFRASASAASIRASRPPPLPFPTPAAHRARILDTTGRADPRRGLLRGHDEHRAVRRRAPSCSSASARSASRATSRFDALFQFSPFYFVVDFSASLSVKVFGVGLFSVRVRGELEGPTPWRVARHGLDLAAVLRHRRSTSTRRGASARDTTLAADRRCCRCWSPSWPKPDELAGAAAARPRPAGRRCASSPEPRPLVLHPVGTLRVSASAPCRSNLTLDRVGSQRPRDVNRFGARRRRRRAAPSAATRPSRSRPPSSRTSPTPTELSPPGLRAARRRGSSCAADGRRWRPAPAVRARRPLRGDHHRHELPALQRRPRRVRHAHAVRATSCSGASVAPLAAVPARDEAAAQPLADARRGRPASGYAVASHADNTASPRASFASEAAAREHLQGAIAADPGLADALHVIPDFELAGA